MSCAIELVQRARRVVPNYGITAVSEADYARLITACDIQEYRVPMDASIVLLPAIGNTLSMMMRDDLRADTRRFWGLHECAHRLNGDADELVFAVYRDPYPDFERPCDLFAAYGIMPERERIGPAEVIEFHLRRRVQADWAPSWKYRAKWIAETLSASEDTCDFS